MLTKGSLQWFREIAQTSGDYLVGIEVSHYPATADVTPRCQVTFIMREVFPERFPESLWKLRDYPGFKAARFTNRGKYVESPVESQRATVLYDFRDDEPCPRQNMLTIASELGLDVVLEFLNNELYTSRLSPSIF